MAEKNDQEVRILTIVESDPVLRMKVMVMVTRITALKAVLTGRSLSA